MVYIIINEEGKRVLVQTVPPFDYPEDLRVLWERVNRFILEELAAEADAVFDVVPILGQMKQPHMARYGGHPDGVGCAAYTTSVFIKIALHCLYSLLPFSLFPTPTQSIYLHDLP